MPRLYIELTSRAPKEELFVVGSHEAMGWWDPSKAAQLCWTGQAWETAEKPLLLGAGPSRVDFKFMHRLGDGAARWEDGPNRVLDVPQCSGQPAILGASGLPAPDDLLLTAAFDGASVTRPWAPGREDLKRWTAENSSMSASSAAPGTEAEAARWKGKYMDAARQLADLRAAADLERQQWSQAERAAARNEEALQEELSTATTDLLSARGRLAAVAAATALGPARPGAAAARARPTPPRMDSFDFEAGRGVVASRLRPTPPRMEREDFEAGRAEAFSSSAKAAPFRPRQSNYYGANEPPTRRFPDGPTDALPRGVFVDKPIGRRCPDGNTDGRARQNDSANQSVSPCEPETVLTVIHHEESGPSDRAVLDALQRGFVAANSGAIAGTSKMAQPAQQSDAAGGITSSSASRGGCDSDSAPRRVDAISKRAEPEQQSDAAGAFSKNSSSHGGDCDDAPRRVFGPAAPSLGLHNSTQAVLLALEHTKAEGSLAVDMQQPMIPGRLTTGSIGSTPRRRLRKGFSPAPWPTSKALPKRLGKPSRQ